MNFGIFILDGLCELFSLSIQQKTNDLCIRVFVAELKYS